MRDLRNSSGGMGPGDVVGTGGKSSHISRGEHVTCGGTSGVGGAYVLGGESENAINIGEIPSCAARVTGDEVVSDHVATVLPWLVTV